MPSENEPRPVDQSRTIPLIDVVIINIPVLLFLGVAAVSGALAFRLRFPAAIAPILASWWSLCGAFMLGADFVKRKRSLYLRLRFPGPPGPGAPLAKSLMQTPCGMSVYAAARRYSRSLRYSRSKRS